MTQTTGWRPLTIAHRAGNHIATIRRAEAVGVDLVEADVWLHRGRLEVRHEKSLGPVPFHWDRWHLRPAWRPALALNDMLDALGPRTGVMLDLKGSAPGLPAALLDALRRHDDGARAIMVSARFWKHLPSLRDLPRLTLLHSVGSRAQLRRVKPLLTERERDAVALHYRLLDDDTVAWLKDHTRLVATWPINDDVRLERTLRWHIDAIISDNLDILRQITAATARTGSV